MSLFYSVVSNPTGEPIVDFQISPNKKLALCATSNTVFIIPSNVLNPPVLCSNHLEKHLRDQFGVIKYSMWLNDAYFIAFTSKLAIILFSLHLVEREFVINAKLSITPTDDIPLLSSYTYHDSIIGTDRKGRILIISYGQGSTYFHQISSSPIQKTVISDNTGYALCEDHSIYTYQAASALFKKENYEVTPTKLEITGSNLYTVGNYILIYNDETDTLYYKSKSDQPFNSIKCPFKFDSLMPSFNNKSIYFISQMQISKFTFSNRNFTDISRSALPQYSAVLVTKDILYFATTKGIHLYQLLHRHDNCFFTQTAVYEAQLLSTGPAIQCYSLDDATLRTIGAIKSVTVSKVIIAVVGSNDLIAIYNTVNKKWFIPTIPEVHPMAIAWMGYNLCVLQGEEGSYSLVVLSPNRESGFDIHHVSPIHAKPFGISADESIITINQQNQIFVTRQDSKILKFRTAFTPKKTRPIFRKRIILSLLMDNSLIMANINNNTKTKLAENVVDFFFDDQFEIATIATINSDNEKILSFFSLKNPSEIIPFGKYDGVPLCQFNCVPMVLLALENDLLHPYFSEFNYKFYTNDIVHASTFVSLLSKYQRYNTFVFKIASEMITDQNVENIPHTIKFLKEFSEFFGKSSSDYFAFFTASEKKEENGLTVFTPKSSAFFDAYNLLSCIMEEEGPNVAYPAAMFLFRQNLEDFEYVIQILKYLEPVITRQSDISNELIDLLEKSVIQCFVELMKKYRPDIAFKLAKVFNRPLSEFLKNAKTVDNSFSFISILDKLTELTSSGTISTKLAGKLQVQIMRAGWIKWLTAFLVINKLPKEFHQILEKRSKIKEEIEGSDKWKHLLEA